MKIAVSNIAWDESEEAAVLDLLDTYKVDGIEVAPTKLWKSPSDATIEDVAQYRDTIESRGRRIVALQALLYGQPDLHLFKSAAIRGKTLDYLAEIARIGGALGAGPLVFGSPKNRQRGDMSLDAARSIAVEFLRECANVCEANDTILCIEPNPPAYDCDFATDTDETSALVREVDHPRIRLHLDSGAMALNGEDYRKSIEANLDILAHFHASEPYLAVIGTGAVDHAAAAAALRESGYDGWVSIEMRNGWTDPNTDAVEQALEFVVATYR